MAWSENIHIHLDNCDQKEIIQLLKEIKEILAGNGGNGDEALRQQIMDKLNAAIADIKSTVS